MNKQIFRIQNENLIVEVDIHGGSLHSIRDREGTEYLWQGDAAYWGRRAPVLFPYVGRFTDGKYLLSGQEYFMSTHGFLRDSDMEVAVQEPEKLTLLLQSSEETKRQYPFAFAVLVSYELKGMELQITFQVENKDSKRMYFGIGGHPGFRIPLEEGLSFEDYRLEFSEQKRPLRVGLSEDGYLEGEAAPYPLKDGRQLFLEHDLFDRDAIVLREMASQVTLLSSKGKKSVCVRYPQMKYLGIWHTPYSDAPFVCIEPWSSLPSRKGIVEDLTQKEDLIALPQGEVYENVWSIQIDP